MLESYAENRTQAWPAFIGPYVGADGRRFPFVRVFALVINKRARCAARKHEEHKSRGHSNVRASVVVFASGGELRQP